MATLPLASADLQQPLWRQPCAWAMLLVASLPLLMASHIVINHFAAPLVGAWSTLIYPEVLAGTILAIMTARRALPAGDRLWTWQLRIAFAIAAWYAVCALLQQAPLSHWPRRIGIEWVLGPVLGVAFAKLGSEKAWRDIQDVYFWSVLVAAFVAIGLYLISFGVPMSFQELIFSNRTYLMQFGIAAGIYFGELTFGGVNDIAAFFGIGLVLYLASVLDEGEPRPLRWLLLPAIFVLLFLTYSRGGLLGLGAACLVLVAAKRRTATPWSNRAWILAAALVTFGALIFVPQGAIAYWRGQLTAQENTSAQFRLRVWSHTLSAERALEDVELDANADAVREMREQTARAFGSLPRPERRGYGGGGAARAETPEEIQERARQREREILALRSRVSANVGGLARRVAFGYGTGNFGLLAGTTPDMSVHNMFIESFVAGGAVGLVLMLTFWTVSVKRAFDYAVSRNTVVAAGPLAVLVFMLVQGQTGHVRLENLGTFILGTVFWWLAARMTAVPAAGRNAVPGDAQGAHPR